MSAAVVTPTFLRQFTARVASLVAEEHFGDPERELTVWLQMALRREASVGQVYSEENLERRLALVRGDARMVQLIRRTFSSIWAQEKAHAAYLEAVLAALVRPSPFLPWLMARMEGVMGAMEGTVLSSRTSPGVAQQARASLMLAAGQWVQDVPEFMQTLSTLPFRDFCLLTSELEITAVHGYQRMVVLLEQLEQRGHFTAETPLKVDIERFIRDEQFHHRAFLEIERWFAPAFGRPGKEGANAVTPLNARVSPDVGRASLRRIKGEVFRGRVCDGPVHPAGAVNGHADGQPEGPQVSNGTA